LKILSLDFLKYDFIEPEGKGICPDNDFLCDYTFCLVLFNFV